MEHIVERILAFRDEIYNKEKAKEVYEVSREEFTFLLGGISSFRMVPGISEHMGFEELYHCKTDEEAAQVKEHLNALWGIVDKDSLLEACYTKYDSSEQSCFKIPACHFRKTAYHCRTYRGPQISGQC